MEKRLYRSVKERMIAGVAGGLAEYFDVDPVLVRLGFVALVFAHGIGAILYVVLWILMRRRPIFQANTGAGLSFSSETRDTAAVPDEHEPEANKARNGKGSFLLGGTMIVIGAIFLLDNLIPGLMLRDFWPVALIGLGAGILWKARTQ